MINLKGKYNSAVVFTNNIELDCEKQILQYLDHPLFGDTKVRIMPDVHLGKGVVIGFTATCNDYVAPNIVGVDIGCGVSACNIKKGNVSFDKLDAFIKKEIPAGKKVHDEENVMVEEAFEFINNTKMDYKDFRKNITEISKKLRISPTRVFNSLGTLGGGNHFIEIDKDQDKNRWLLVHSGSRNFGLQVAMYHNQIAVSRTPESTIKFLSGPAAEEYRYDMAVAQLYARVNRALISLHIGCKFFKTPKKKLEWVESIHNYIDFDEQIIRKGAISAKAGERVIIPFSMADGAVIGTGKSNPDWNYSAPHGSGRKLSRTAAKSLSLDEYRKRMKNIWSSCVSKATLDESPMAYKKVNDILDFIGETVEVTHRLKPVYNFKADS